MMTMREDPAREACRERCAEFGDPPCYEIWQDSPSPAEQRDGKWVPCAECLRDVGIEVGDEFDETAAVGRLL